MWESIVSLIVGILASQIISKYYYKRGLKKHLTPYVKFSSSPLDGVDPGVRSAMEITYQGQRLTAFHEIQFLVANTGDKAIRDIIDPLSIDIPDDCLLLDATILFASPEGRKVDAQYDPDARRVAFDFLLLNPRDFFIAKLLLMASQRLMILSLR